MADRHKSTDTSKVMDITHPAHVQPSTTSRPVIVSNRPMIPEDPMINQAAQSAITTEKPAGAPKKPEVPEVSSAPEINRQGKTIIPIVDHKDEDAKNEAETTATPSEPVVSAKSAEEPSSVPVIAIDADAKNDGVPVSDPEDAKTKDGKADSVSAGDSEAKDVDMKDAADTEEIQPSADDAKETAENALESKKPADAPKDAKTEPESTSVSFDAASSGDSKVTDSVGAFSEITTADGQIDEGNSESREKTAEEKRESELEVLVAAGTYHVPIGQVAKRRGRMIAIIFVVFILLLVLFDLALDMGLLKISGIPHTTFLQ